MITTQLMLVSEQAAPNLLAALDPNMKPHEAVLLVSEKMSRRAEAMAVVLQEAGVKVSRVSLADEHDPTALENALMDVASERDGQAITINVTGGTKLMALAAQSVAQAAGWPAFYVDVDTDQVIWLDKARPVQALSQQLRINHYLRGYGFTLYTSNDRVSELFLKIGQVSHFTPRLLMGSKSVFPLQKQASRLLKPSR